MSLMPILFCYISQAIGQNNFAPLPQKCLEKQ